MSPMCDKFHPSESSLFHSFIICTQTTPLCSDVFKNISEIINTPVNPGPLLIILGVSEALRRLNKTSNSFCLSASSQRKCYDMSWKETTVTPSKLHLERL